MRRRGRGCWRVSHQRAPVRDDSAGVERSTDGDVGGGPRGAEAADLRRPAGPWSPRPPVCGALPAATAPTSGDGTRGLGSAAILGPALEPERWFGSVSCQVRLHEWMHRVHLHE